MKGVNGLSHWVKPTDRRFLVRGGVTALQPIRRYSEDGVWVYTWMPLTVPLLRFALDAPIAKCDRGCTLVEVLTQVAESDYERFGSFEPVSVVMRANPPVMAHLALDGERLRWMPGLVESDITFIW